MMNKIISLGYSKTLERLAQYSLVATTFFIPISSTLSDILYLFTILSVLLSGIWIRERKTIFQNPIAVSFLIYFLLYVIGLTYTIAPHHDAIRDFYKHYWVLFTPFLFPLFLNEQCRRNVLYAFATTMLLTLFLSYLKIIFHFNLLHLFEGSEVFTHRITQNFFMTFFAGLLIYEYFRSNNTILRGVLIILFLLISFNIFFLSESRTGYIIYPALLFYIFIMRFRWKGIIYACTTTAHLFALAFAFSTPFKDRLILAFQKRHSNNPTASVGVRINMIKNSMVLIKKHPWFGYGTGNLKTAYATLPAADIAKTGLIDRMETDYLNITLEFGVVGLSLFLVFSFLQCYYSFFLRPDLRFITQTFLLTYLIGAIGNQFFYSFHETHLYSVLIALCFSSLKPLRQLSVDFLKKNEMAYNKTVEEN